MQSGKYPDTLKDISTTVLEEVSKAVLKHANSNSAVVILSRVSHLAAAAENLGSSSLVCMLQSLVESLIPLGLDLVFSPSNQNESRTQLLSSLTDASCVRWETRTRQFPSGLTQRLPKNSSWSPLHASIAAVQIYRSFADASSYAQDLAGVAHASFAPALLSSMSAAYDVLFVESLPTPKISLDLIDELLVYITSKSKPLQQKREAARYLCTLYQHGIDCRRSLIPRIVAHIASLPCHHFFRAPLQLLLWRLARTTEKDLLSSLVDPVVDRGLYLAVRQSSET